MSTIISQWLMPLANSLLYCVVGVIVFALSYLVIVKISPFSVKKEIAEDQNIALGIIVGAVFIGLSIIIAAAIH